MPDNSDVERCRERILSNDYADFIIRLNALDSWYIEELGDYCMEEINPQYGVIHLERSQIPEISTAAYGYHSIPKLYTLLDTTSMDASGITSVIDQPSLNLRGEGTLIGFVDTGIDYQNPIFQTESGSTRVLAIWDQTIQDGDPPELFAYGTEYLSEDINRALVSADPLAVVPSIDENGHGTFVAGIAAGRRDTENDFVGAAPACQIVAVKLKPAKQYLRDYFLTGDDAPGYQDTDILMGVRYLVEVSQKLNMPMVVYIGLGTNSGDHTSNGTMERILNLLGSRAGFCIVVAAGNEGARGHHYQGLITGQGEYEDVEIRVGEGENGFTLEAWADASELLSVGVVTPTGEYTTRIPPRINESQVLRFILDNTEIYINYGIVEVETGSPLIFMRFINPTPGIWRVRVFSSLHISGVYHMWLPITGFINPETVFLRPNPDTTITSPTPATNAIGVSAYDHVTGAIYIHSSRGFTRNGDIKPDLAAPGVNVYGPGLRNQYVTMSGTSVAAAHVAGAAASLLSWGVVRRNDPTMASSNVRAYMIRGATRTPGQVYPSPEWGYGRLNLYNVFETLRITL